MSDGQFRNGCTDRFGHMLGTLERRARQENRKFLATESRYHITGARDERTQCHCDRAQALISRLMTEAIIELLEMICVDHQQRQRCLPARGKPPLLLKMIIQRTAIGYIRESVERCQHGCAGKRVAQLLVHPPLLEEEDRDCQEADEVETQI